MYYTGERNFEKAQGVLRLNLKYYKKKGELGLYPQSQCMCFILKFYNFQWDVCEQSSMNRFWHERTTT